jgi:ATP:ADP antiporter, AAA family
MAVINRLLRLQKGEAGLVFVLGLLLFGNSLAQPISEITAISNFLSEGGVNSILVVWAVDAAIILLVTGLQSLVVDKYSRIDLTRWMLFALALSFIVLRLLFVLGAPGWFNYALLYLLAEQQWLFFPLVFWVLANDLFDMNQAKRLFPLIAGIGFVGRLAGIGISAAAPALMARIPTFRVEELLVFNALVYLVIFFVFMESTRKFKVRATVQSTQTVKETLSEGWDFVKGVPAFGYLALSILALLVAGTVIEFHFLVVTDRAFTTPAHYQTFYSLYRLSVTVAAILIQVLITSRIMARFNLKNLFFVMPVSALLGAVWALFQPGAIGGIAAMIVLRLPQLTVDESTRKAFQTLVPEERRGRVSVFMDSYLYCIGSIIGCLLTGAVVGIGIWSGWSWVYNLYLGVAVVTSIAATLAIVKMRQVYDVSILNWRLKRRQRGKSVLDKLQFE